MTKKQTNLLLAGAGVAAFLWWWNTPEQKARRQSVQSPPTPLSPELDYRQMAIEAGVSGYR